MYQHIQSSLYDGVGQSIPQNRKDSQNIQFSPSSLQFIYPYLFDNAATPGSSLPSRSSNEAPPPVETWLSLSSAP